MNQSATHHVTSSKAQGSLFSFAMLPYHPRCFKGGMETEFLPPRERRSL